MKVKLGELTKIRTGKLDANAASENGKYPFFTCSKEPLRISTYSYDCECVLVAGNGDLNVKYYNGKFDAYQRTYIIESNGDGRLHLPYLYYFMTRYIQELRKLSIGGVIKYIKLGNLTDAEISLPSIKEQKDACEKLKKVKDIIDKKEAQISYLDNLIKARFVEMFGNSTMEKTIGEVATICRGASPRPISKFITKSNGENWIKIGDAKEDDIYITKTKELVTEDGANRSRRIKPGDFILSNSMSFGRPYISKIYGCVHDGWLIVSDYEQSFLPLFFYYAIRSELVQAQFRKSVAGAVVKNLNSDLVRSVKIVIPSIESQEKFSSFAKQIDKSKFILSNELTMCDFHIRLIHDRVMHSCINLRVAQ